jgi:hypothetical protein
MKRMIVVAVLMVACITLAVSAGWSVTATQSVTISATVASKAKLALSAATVTFPDADPDATPSIGAAENPVTATVKATTGSASTVTLTVQAGGADLVSGTDQIAISNVTWTASGAGFVAGTMNTTAQSAGSWTGSGSRSGTFSYFLANSWAYPKGSYTQTAVYTLTAP